MNTARLENTSCTSIAQRFEGREQETSHKHPSLGTIDKSDANRAACRLTCSVKHVMKSSFNLLHRKYSQSHPRMANLISHVHCVALCTERIVLRYDIPDLHSLVACGVVQGRFFFNLLVYVDSGGRVLDNILK